MSSAIAQFQVFVGTDQYASVIKVDETEMFILGIASRAMPAGLEYRIRIAGVKNPRYQILNAAANPDQYFRIETYDAGLDPSTMVNADTQHLIDAGSGGSYDIDELSKISTFGAEAFNTTNGVATRYFLSWFTDIETEDKDVLRVTIPAELSLVPQSGSSLTCRGITGISSVTCA